MYVSSRQGYKPPVKSTGRGKKYSHFASLKYCREFNKQVQNYEMFL